MLHKLKPTPIYQDNIKYIITSVEHEHIQSLQMEYKQASNNFISNDVQVLNHPSMNYLKRYVELELFNFKKNILGIPQDLYITQSWIAKTNPGGWHDRHEHPNSMFSGVIYISTPNNASIRFLHSNDLFKTFRFDINFHTTTEFNAFYTDVSVRQNDIIIFPSWLEHAVAVNDSSEPRVVLGFNTFIKGNFGHDVYPTKLTLLGDNNDN
jgi:uncharacterized protein (TIGR02466 family)